MFTGIIEQTGAVKSVEKKGTSGRITIEAALEEGFISIGGSISVDGVCLTVTALKKGSFAADLSPETVKLTTLGSLRAGDTVNLELPLTLSKPLGGHLVTGHIDGIGKIEKKTAGAGFVEMDFSFQPALAGQLVKKGSVAVDGISLTIADILPGAFRVAVIPHTLKHTTLSRKGEGDSVNIETDIIAKYVERYFENLAGGDGGRAGKAAGGERKAAVTEGLLEEHGFLKKG